MILMLIFWWYPAAPSYVADKIFSPLFKGESYIRQNLGEDFSEQSKDQVAELDFLREENKELRSLLSDHTTPGIAAGVIARPASLPYDALVIDRGHTDGILEGAPVYASAGQAVGVVASVYANSSVVALVSTPGWKSTVYLYGSNIYTTMEGQGGGIARVHVPQGVSLEVGNIAAVPVLGSGIFGRVSFVDSVPSRPEQYGYVAMETPISSLRYVTVGTRSLSAISFDEAKEVIDQTRRDFLEVPVPEGVLVDVEQATSTSTPEATATSTTPDEL